MMINGRSSPRRLVTVVALYLIGPFGCATTRPKNHDNDVARVRVSLAANRAEQRDWAGALEALEPLPRERDARVDALTIRGTVFREKGLLEEAEADLKEAIELGSDRAAPHAALAVVYDLRGDLDRGATHHARAVELQPENPRYLNDLAFSLFVRGKPREAVPMYVRALRVTPEDRRIRNNLGFALARSGEFQRARQQFVLAGSAAEARNNLGYAYEQAGNLSQAYEQYLEAARLDPGLRQARSNLRHVAEKLHRTIPPDLTGEGGQS